jgi:hypothetical protein
MYNVYSISRMIGLHKIQMIQAGLYNTYSESGVLFVEEESYSVPLLPGIIQSAERLGTIPPSATRFLIIARH